MIDVLWLEASRTMAVRGRSRRVLSLLALSIISLAVEASAAIIGTAGDLTVLSSPPFSVDIDDLQSNSQVFVFQEQASRILPQDIGAILAQPGTIFRGNNVPAAGQLFAGAVVDDYLIHADFVSLQGHYTGIITFDRDILAVIPIRAQLDGSDGILAHPNTEYPSGRSDRGIEGVDDQVGFDFDRRSMAISFELSSTSVPQDHIDQIRVITAASPSANQFKWINPSHSQWNVPTNWDMGIVPNSSTASVTFDVSELVIVTMSSSHTVGQLEFNGGSVDLVRTGGHSLTLGGVATIATPGNSSYRIDVPISGTSGLKKTGAGPLLLSGQNTYSGGTTVQAGTLSVRNHPLPSGTIDIQAGAILETDGFVTYSLQPGQTLSGGGRLRTRHGFSDTELTIAPTSQVRGSLTIETGLVVNSGRLSPGFSPGIITIDGDYVGEFDGVLEMEVGGLTPGTQHDQLIVTGSASLGGRLELRLINNFVPAVNSQIVIIDADDVSGQFHSILAPELTPALGRAVDIDVGSVPGEVRVRFVSPNTANTFEGQAVVADWTAGFNWSIQPPRTTDIVQIAPNQAVFNQRLNVTTNAFAHELSVQSATANQMTVAVNSGAHLSATQEVSIGRAGTIELAGGELVSRTIEIGADGSLIGQGSIVGNVQLGIGTSGNAATLAPGTATTKGVMEIEGNLTQSAVGALVLNVGGTGAGEFDQLAISGTAQLSGNLEVVYDNSTVAVPGNSWTLITATDVTAQFQSIEFRNQANGTYTAVDVRDTPSTPGGVIFLLRDVGDLNGDLIIDSRDAPLFAEALFNPSAFNPLFDSTGHEAADMNADGQLDFDDIDDFANSVSDMEPDAVIAAIRSAIPGVPEPSSLWPLLLSSALMARRERPIRPTKPRHG